MGWFSDLFTTKDVVTDSGLPKVSNIPPMPKVKPCKPEKTISEPVISFVECVRNTPKRFYAHSDTFYQGKYWSPSYVIEDKKTKEIFILAGSYPPIFDFPSYKINHVNWLTDGEKAYLIENISSIYEKLKWRKDKLLSIRKVRKEKQERNRLTNIYKEIK